MCSETSLQWFVTCNLLCIDTFKKWKCYFWFKSNWLDLIPDEILETIIFWREKPLKFKWMDLQTYLIQEWNWITIFKVQYLLKCLSIPGKHWTKRQHLYSETIISVNFFFNAWIEDLCIYFKHWHQKPT